MKERNTGIQSDRLTEENRWGGSYMKAKGPATALPQTIGIVTGAIGFHVAI
jgi:hypothetical protein